MWNKLNLVRRRYKGVELMFLFSDVLSLIINRLSVISNKCLLYSRAKILNLSKEGKMLQWSKWPQTALLFDGMTIFPVRDDTPICSSALLCNCLILLKVKNRR